MIGSQPLRCSSHLHPLLWRLLSCSDELSYCAGNNSLEFSLISSLSFHFVSSCPSDLALQCLHDMRTATPSQSFHSNTTTHQLRQILPSLHSIPLLFLLLEPLHAAPVFLLFSSRQLTVIAPLHCRTQHHLWPESAPISMLNRLLFLHLFLRIIETY